MRFVLPAVILVFLLPGCGPGQSGTDRTDVTASIYADKGVFVSLDLPGSSRDSVIYRSELPMELVLYSENCTSSFTAMLVPGVGSSPADRLEYLSGSDVKNLDTAIVQPHGDAEAFTAVVYVRGDSSVVERIWNRGNRELAVLQVKCSNTSLNILLTSVSSILSTAGLSEELSGLERNVYLSDRTREEIVREVNSDVAVPPEIDHSIDLSIDPSAREIRVIDTLRINFGSTLSDSQLSMYLPRCEDGTSFEPVIGSVSGNGDSVICQADSSRMFQGIYSGSWNGFMSSSPDRITSSGMRIDRTISFQCGMWFYPGCDIPASYSFEISVPQMHGYDVYAPLEETRRSVDDTLLTVSYRSPSGGVRGPLAWAAGGFMTHPIASGRSRFVCSQSDPSELLTIADEMTEVFWRDLGYEGGGLDLIIVDVLDIPVAVRGPGCIFLSGAMMHELSGYRNWADTLSTGGSVSQTAIVFEAARAFLAGSTYLSENLRDVLAAWAVFRFISSGGDDTKRVLMEALRKYYFYSSEVGGGIEYSIADPHLATSDLYEPVIMGKAPMVMEFLHDEIPAFQRAIPRALGNLRHSGDSFARLFSAMGVMENSIYGEMYFQWLYSPGLPMILVKWSDSPDVLHLDIRQYQPGQDFPLGSVLDHASVGTENGMYSVNLNQGATRGYYTADLTDIPDRVTSVDIDPSGRLPADIVYDHVSRPDDGI